MLLTANVPPGPCKVLLHWPSGSQRSNLHGIIWIFAHIWTFPCFLLKTFSSNSLEQMCCLQHSWRVPPCTHTPVPPLAHSCFLPLLPFHTTPLQRSRNSIPCHRTEGNFFFPSLLNLIQLFDVNSQGTVGSLVPHQPSSPLALVSPPQPLAPAEGITKIFGFSQPQRTQGHHWTYEITQRWVWSSFSCLPCNTWLLSWGKAWNNIWSQLPLSSCNQSFSFPDTIYLGCLAAQLALLLLLRNTTTCRCYLYTRQIISATIFSQWNRPRVPSKRWESWSVTVKDVLAPSEK